MKNNKPSHIKLYGKPVEEDPEPDNYQVVKNNEVLFESPIRALCNSFICRNAIQGVRPTLEK